MSVVEALLRKHGAVLARTKNHRVYKFPDGRIFVLPSTASDWRAERNQMRDLRKMVGKL